MSLNLKGEVYALRSTEPPLSAPTSKVSEIEYKPGTSPIDGALTDLDAVDEAGCSTSSAWPYEARALASVLAPAEQRILRDQIERANVSVLLMIAEDAGRRSRRDKRHYYAMARGSATECAAAI